jgi:hypothetical protein
VRRRVLDAVAVFGPGELEVARKIGSFGTGRRIWHGYELGAKFKIAGYVS